VITNGLRIASELAGYPGITVAMPGGFVRWEALSVVGQLGTGLFEQVNVQKAIIGAAGFTLESGLSDATEEEAQIKRLMVGAATEVIAIIDSTKWGRAAFATFCRTADLTAVVTDSSAPIAMTTALAERGVDLRLVSVDAIGTGTNTSPVSDRQR
jgi:DeoR/GlpR family transcriptional regulator of sugar metabolism